ncbi:MAG: AAA family ATPase, partial [Ilumatobacteraceae bacterium]
KGNLPLELTPFVGRVAELSAVIDTVAEHRLVTLIGVGGTGKTRLAIEAAGRLAPTFPDGCWLVQLAHVSTPEAVPTAMAAGLGVSPPESGDVVEAIIRSLRHERRLVIVDNCEHVLDAAAEVVERVAAQCATVSVLATSREPLMLPGEHLTPTPSLSHDDAVALFLDRSGAAAAGFGHDERQLAAVHDLCDRLDRLPLAIELAASRMRTMTPTEAVELLGHRFRLLVGGSRSRLERHQTMRNTVAWSYDLCDEDEQLLFDRLSVFPAEFELAAAASVVPDDRLDRVAVSEVLARLLDRSLIERQITETGTTRFRLLETMRAYGHERLIERGEAEEVREAHAVHVDTTICALGLRSMGPDERAVHAQIRALVPDVLAALEWSADHDDWNRVYRIGSSCLFGMPSVTFVMADKLDVALRAGRDVDIGPTARLFIRVSSWHRYDDAEAAAAHMNDVRQQAISHLEQRVPLPTGYFALGPLLAIGGVESEHLDGLLRGWLESISEAPLQVRFTETIAALERTAATDVEFGLECLTRARQLADDLDSDLARRRCLSIELLMVDRTDSDPTEVVDRARLALATVDMPVIGDRYLAGRFLRVVSRSPSSVRGDDVRRAVGWMSDRGDEPGDVAMQMALAVALPRLGRLDLAERMIATVGPDPLRPGAAATHESTLPPHLTERLRNESRGDEPILAVVSDILRFADEIDNERSEA